MAWLISIKTGNEMKLPRESFSLGTHIDTDTHTPPILTSFQISSINPIIFMCVPFTPETGIYIYSTMAGAIGFSMRVLSRLSCRCCRRRGWWWMESLSPLPHFYFSSSSRLQTHTQAHSTRRLNWSPSYFSLRTRNNNNNRQRLLLPMVDRSFTRRQALEM